MKDKDITLNISNNVINHLSKIGYNAEYGARPLQRVIRNEIQNMLAKAVIEQSITTGDHVNIDYNKEEEKYQIL